MPEKEIDFSLYASMMLPRPDRSPALSTRSLPTPPQGKDTLANRMGHRRRSINRDSIDSPSLASLSTYGGISDSDSDDEDDESAGPSMTIQINRVPIAADCYDRDGLNSASSISSSGLQLVSSDTSSASDASMIPEGSPPLTPTSKEVSSGFNGMSLTASSFSPSHIEASESNCNGNDDHGSKNSLAAIDAEHPRGEEP